MTDAGIMRAFSERADGVRETGAGLVGVFGEGVPLPLVAAFDALAVDVKAPPLADASGGPQAACVAAVVEDFMDPFAARFLHRFAAGAFDRFALIVFARDDVAALSAYQYAQELRRLGMVARPGPRLHLWNLTHGGSAAIARFNAAELARLMRTLAEVFGKDPSDASLAAAIAAERRRAAALAALPAGGEEGFVRRNAGRWLTPEAHAAALSAQAAGGGTPDHGPRIALLGTACDTPVLHRACAGLGRVVADLQDYGRAPAAPPAEADATALVAALAADPLQIRAAPPHRFSRALVEGCATADLVISSVDRTDDAFGWEMPMLRDAVTARGARFLDLGFRPFRPDAAWCDAARGRIAEALS